MAHSAAVQGALISPVGHAQAVFFLRQLVGWWFFMLGRFKLFDAGTAAIVEEAFVKGYSGGWIPEFALRLGGYFDVYAEFLCGLMLILGFRVRLAVWLLMALLVMVTFGHQVKEATFAMGPRVFPPAMGLVGIALLYTPARDVLSVDALTARLHTRLFGAVAGGPKRPA
ncbi:MAG: hypothetical protein C0468_01950 [Planctomyces sp.]|nr:hypothetical protein [Planctomyces sp.]MBA4120133.1 hypothetical protein [Isosphaera sp.]